MAGKMCYNRQDTGESDFCFVSGTKKETFFDTREEEECGNTTKIQMSWKRQCAAAGGDLLGRHDVGVLFREGPGKA